MFQIGQANAVLGQQHTVVRAVVTQPLLHISSTQNRQTSRLIAICYVTSVIIGFKESVPPKAINISFHLALIYYRYYTIERYYR